MELEAKWDRILDLRGDVAKALELARQQKVIGHSLNAKVDIFPTEEQYPFLTALKEQLAMIFIVSTVELHGPGESIPEGAVEAEQHPGLQLVVIQAPGEKCERCWMYSEEVGHASEHPSLCPRCAGVVAIL